MYRYIFSIIFIIQVSLLVGQDSKLANEYYRTGEYEKSAQMYKMLSEKTNHNDFYFNRYVESLLALEEYEQSEKVVNSQIKRFPKNVQLYVTYGNIYERLGDQVKADEQFAKAIKNLRPDKVVVSNLGNAFTRLTKYDLALKTFHLGEALLEDQGVFAYSLADIYKRKGDTNNMIKYYLISIKSNPSRVNSLKTYFMRNLQKEDFTELKAQLYERIQEEPDNIDYPEMLEWVFIQDKEYAKALRQSKALDKRLGENGFRIYDLAQIAANDFDYETSISAYNYIIKDKGTNSTYYMSSRTELLSVMKKRILRNKGLSKEELVDLRTNYESFISEIGKNNQSAYVISELANLEAYYLDNLDGAIALLDEMVNLPGVNKTISARGKISLADLYVIKGDVWEATLLYSQVDKLFREAYLGEMARFKNAKLSYYIGDFEWAQSQFDILKSSTSKLISNDAIDLSVFIMDNMGLDTTDVPLKMYAQSELLSFQNKYNEAFKVLDEISTTYPDHTLLDDILYAKAKIYVKQRDYASAIPLYEKVISNHPEEIRCDNSIYELARIYEDQLDEPERASELYEKLFIEFSNSTLAINARKRFRLLRGDEI